MAMAQDTTLTLLLFSLYVQGGECAVGAAAGGAAAVLGGGGGGDVSVRDEDREVLVIFLMGAMVVGVAVVSITIQGYKLVRKYIMKIPDPPKSFILDKKVKCQSGHNMLMFHIPSNISSFIKCGSQSSCDKRQDLAGFDAWYSCPVCGYRVCSGCAAVDIHDTSKNENTVENLFSTQFANFGRKKAVGPNDVESNLPGQV